MKTTIILCVCGMLAVPVHVFSAQQDPPVTPQVQQPGMRPVKAKPAQKPNSTTTRDKMSATGYGEDPGEETQERPNPLNKQGQNRPEQPVKAPVR